LKDDAQPEHEPRPNDDEEIDSQLDLLPQAHASTPDHITEEAENHLSSEADDLQSNLIGDGDNLAVGNQERLDFLNEERSLRDDVL
jgi:hypothetical protein